MHMSLIIQMCPEIKSKILLSWKLTAVEMMVPLPSLCLQDCFVRTLQSCGTRCAAEAAFWSSMVWKLHDAVCLQLLTAEPAFCSLQNFLLSTCSNRQSDLTTAARWLMILCCLENRSIQVYRTSFSVCTFSSAVEVLVHQKSSLFCSGFLTLFCLELESMSYNIRSPEKLRSDFSTRRLHLLY